MRHFNDDAQLVRRLAHEHLGPIPELDATQEATVQAALRNIPDHVPLSERNCLAACTLAGVTISRRQLRRYRDDEIMRRMAAEVRDLRRSTRP